jgi:hypothetical protein
VIAALPAACRALDPQHIEAINQTADRAIEGHGTAALSAFAWFSLFEARPRLSQLPAP